MSFTHQIQTSWNNGGASVADSANYTADGETNRDPEIAAATNDVEVAIAFDPADLVAIYISSNADVTIETNSGSDAADTLSISAGVPFVWTNDSGITNPFSEAVTAFFISNAGAAEATVKIRALHDSTPS